MKTFLKVLSLLLYLHTESLWFEVSSLSCIPVCAVRLLLYFTVFLFAFNRKSSVVKTPNFLILLLHKKAFRQ